MTLRCPDKLAILSYQASCLYVWLSAIRDSVQLVCPWGVQKQHWILITSLFNPVPHDFNFFCKKMILVVFMYGFLYQNYNFFLLCGFSILNFTQNVLYNIENGNVSLKLEINKNNILHYKINLLNLTVISDCLSLFLPRYSHSLSLEQWFFNYCKTLSVLN